MKYPPTLDASPCSLGEGPIWDVSTETLYWIDIWGKQLHSWSADGTRDWALPAVPGCVLFGPPGTLVLALATGIVAFDPAVGTITGLVHPGASGPGGRYNDGAVDPAGRIWVGSVETGPGARNGVLYRIDTDGTVAAVRHGLGTPNGIGFSPAGDRMYFTVSEDRQVVSYDYDLATGAISGERVLISDVNGSPDGLIVDAEGALWSAKWDGWRITRHGPDGTLLAEYELPVPNVTSLGFGGPGLTRLFVTTAAADTESTRPGFESDAGRVFVLDDVGAAGQPEHRANIGQVSAGGGA